MRSAAAAAWLMVSGLLWVAACTSEAPPDDGGDPGGPVLRQDGGDDGGAPPGPGPADAGDGGQPGGADGGDGGSWHPAPDGGTCDTPQDCPCFSNHDCPSSHRCESQDDTGANVYCVVGARGTKAKGQPCQGESDCASALCIDSEVAGNVCSDLCDKKEDCPGNLPRCLYVGFGVDDSICAPPAP